MVTMQTIYSPAMPQKTKAPILAQSLDPSKFEYIEIPAPSKVITITVMAIALIDLLALSSPYSASFAPTII